MVVKKATPIVEATTDGSKEKLKEDPGVLWLLLVLGVAIRRLVIVNLVHVVEDVCEVGGSDYELLHIGKMHVLFYDK